MPGSNLTVYGEKSPQSQLEPAAIAPGADGICKTSRFGAALEAESAERIGHESLAQPRIHGAEDEVCVRSPHEVRACLTTECLKGGRRDTESAASANAEIRGTDAEREPAQRSRYGCRVVESSKDLHAPSYLGKERDGQQQIRQDTKETGQASQVHGRLHGRG
jgi:hypothetical protein